jgi:hypothetical protein
MAFFGDIPAWITVIIAALSLKYLIAYARSAKQQVEVSVNQVKISEKLAREQMRPILVVTEVKTTAPGVRSFVVQNQGLGAALDIRWQSQGEPTDHNRSYGPTLVLGPNATFSDTFTAPDDTKLFFIYFSTFDEELRTEILVTEELFTNRYYPKSGARVLRAM